MSEKSLLDKGVEDIAEQYFEYPTKSIRPAEVWARQNIFYLLGAIHALKDKP